MSRANASNRPSLPAPCALIALAAFLLLHGGVSAHAGEATSPAELKPADAAHARSLVGPWQVSSLSIQDKNGNPQVFGRRTSRPLSVIFSEKTVALRVGEELIAESPYVLDPTQTPCTIDVKSDAGDLLGIYQRVDYIRDDQLQSGLSMSLNDAAKGRPKNNNRQQSGLSLSLERFPTLPLFVINADGTDLHQIVAIPEFTSAGSPDWSRDGHRIVFDATRSIFGEDWSTAHIFVVNADGSSPKDLGPGAMPSWSHDDKQITFIEFQPQRGVGIMDADGSNRQMIAPEGWGSQWCPKRNEIAFTTSQDGRPNLCIYDVASKQRRMLLDSPYRQVYEGFTWSPDGKWICFKGDLAAGGSEVAAVSAEGEKHGFEVILPATAQPESDNVSKTMAWGGTGNQILVTMQTKTDRMLQLYLLDFARVDSPTRFPEFPADWMSDDMAWSPDGKKVVFSARPAITR